MSEINRQEIESGNITPLLEEAREILVSLNQKREQLLAELGPKRIELERLQGEVSTLNTELVSVGLNISATERDISKMETQ